MSRSRFSNKHKRFLIQISLFLPICAITTLRMSKPVPEDPSIYKSSFVQTLSEKSKDIYASHQNMTPITVSKKGFFVDPTTKQKMILLKIINSNKALYMFKNKKSCDSIKAISLIDDELWIHEINLYSAYLHSINSDLMESTKHPETPLLRKNDIWKKIAIQHQELIDIHPSKRIGFKKNNHSLLQSKNDIELFLQQHKKKQYIVTIFEKNCTTKIVNFILIPVTFQKNHAINIPIAGINTIVGVLNKNECLVKTPDNLYRIIGFYFNHIYWSDQYYIDINTPIEDKMKHLSLVEHIKISE